MAPEKADLVARALRRALEAHAGQTRKGSDVPYVTHCIRVAALVMQHGGTPEQIAIALLHDTVEDCDEVTEASLTVEFGTRVAAQVAVLSDTLPGDTVSRKSPWRERKEAYIARLRGADETVHLVAACDKLDNLRSLVADIDQHGVVTLERFSASPRQTRWYYETVREGIGDVPQELAAELEALTRLLARHIPEASVER